MDGTRNTSLSPGGTLTPEVAARLPPQTYFLISAVFHYLGPAFAVLLFAAVAPLGVAWLRIASAAVIFALWRRPWRRFDRVEPSTRRTIVMLGVVLALMNASFYLAIARVPLATVGAIEFIGPIALAAVALRGWRNTTALVLAVLGVYALTRVRIEGSPLGFLFTFLNCGLFVLYIVLGHRIAEHGGARGVDNLAAAMAIALVAAVPIGLYEAIPALTRPLLLAAGIGIGVCSSVIPYVCDQLAMARLPRASFALLLSLLPAVATVIGLVVLRQIPRPVEVMGILMIIGGVLLHDSEGRGTRKPDSRGRK